MFFFKLLLTLSWRRLLSYRNQSIDLLGKSMDWFLYDKDLRHERMKKNIESNIFFEVQNYYFVFESVLIFFFKWSYSQRCFDVAQRCENRRWKWQRCFDVVQQCSVQRWKTQRCFNIVLRCKFQRWQTQRCFNADLTLCDVATLYQPKNNVELTLKCLLGIQIYLVK